MSTNSHTLARWRLVLGKQAEEHGINVGDDADAQRIESLVGFLFEGGEGGGRGRASGRKGREGRSRFDGPRLGRSGERVVPESVPRGNAKRTRPSSRHRGIDGETRTVGEDRAEHGVGQNLIDTP